MEFGKHIGKGVWASADKALPAVYGIGFIFLVVRVLPEKEWGAFAVIQIIFTVVSSLGFSLALQPLTKFAAETDENGPYIVASLAIISGFFGVLSGIMVGLKDYFVPWLVDPNGQGSVNRLIVYIPLLLFGSLVKAFAVSLLQASYKVARIFWMDAAYFLGTLVFFLIAQKLHHFSSAADVVQLNVLGQLVSSALAFFLVRRSLNVKLTVSKEAFVKMWNFGKYNFGSIANYLVYSQMDGFFVSSFAGVVALGFYSAAKIVTRIFDMLSQVLQMFIMPAASKFYSSGERSKLTIIIEKSISFSLLLLLPVLAIILLFPQPILHFLYSGKYDSASNIFLIFGFLSLTTPWTGVGSAVVVGIGKVRFALYAGLIVSATSLVLFWFLVRIFGPVGIALALVLTNLISAIILSFFVKRIVGFSVLNIARRVKDVWMFVREYISPLLQND